MAVQYKLIEAWPAHTRCRWRLLHLGVIAILVPSGKQARSISLNFIFQEEQWTYFSFPNHLHTAASQLRQVDTFALTRT